MLYLTNSFCDILFVNINEIISINIIVKNVLQYYNHRRKTAILCEFSLFRKLCQKIARTLSAVLK